MSDQKQAAVQPGVVAASMRTKLEASFSPVSLEIIDEFA